MPDRAEMQSYSSSAAAGALPPLMALDLQDHLMVADNDLARLQRLLSDVCDVLLLHPCGADSALMRVVQASPAGGEDGHCSSRPIQPGDAARNGPWMHRTALNTRPRGPYPRLVHHLEPPRPGAPPCTRSLL